MSDFKITNITRSDAESDLEILGASAQSRGHVAFLHLTSRQNPNSQGTTRYQVNNNAYSQVAFWTGHLQKVLSPGGNSNLVSCFVGRSRSSQPDGGL